MSDLGSEAQPLRVAIVGSGPSGFYAAEALFKSGVSVTVDMFDRLPTPFGLVRGGVAPDHPKIKNVIKVYDRIAHTPGFAFWGNVCVGEDLTVDELHQYYDAIIFASGAETDRHLNIPGIDLAGSYAATEFVGWYNGHPDYRDRTFDLSGESAVVVGQGNVAMDVSRILAKTVDELRNTDIAEHALDALAESKIKEVHLVGRRGPVQAKFTPPEIREIGELDDCDVIIEDGALDLDEMALAELAAAETHVRKNVSILRELASKPLENKSRKYFIHFFLGPKALEGAGHVEKIVLERNRLEGEPGLMRAVGTGELTTLPCDLFFRSVGYHGVPIKGVPFDEQAGIIPHVLGRVVSPDGDAGSLYVTGWIKRGPSGVIGTNKPDSVETVHTLLDDLPSMAPAPIRQSVKLLDMFAAKGLTVVDYDGWKKIDVAETARGASAGKPREKFTRVEEMLEALSQ